MSPSRPREPWPFVVAAMLAAMISGSLGFFWIAVRHPDAAVVEDAYDAGLRLNQELRARHEAEARGLELRLRTRPGADGTLGVEVELRDEAGHSVLADQVSVRRERPAQGGFDADFALRATGEGWRGSVPLPLPGRWRLVATAEFGDALLRRVFEVDGL